MKRKKEYFTIGNWVFWIILCLILILSLPFMRGMLYKGDRLRGWLENFDTIPVAKMDSLRQIQPPKDELVKITWAWNDLNQKRRNISFFAASNAVQKIRPFRENYPKIQSDEALGQLYRDFIEKSSDVIDSMASAMKNDIQKSGLRSNREILNYIVSAIQYPVYTKITDSKECPCRDMGQNWFDDCRERQDGKGCCNNIVPIGIFTPTEFIFKRTGDCDTKALIAFALVKRFGFDAAVIVGDVQENGRHAMLAIANIEPEVMSRKYVQLNSKIYFPWEVTGRGFRFGDASIWTVWKNWYVSVN